MNNNEIKLIRTNLIDVDKLTRFANLWNLNLSNNKIECLRGLSRLVALGKVNLSWNKLSWQALNSIKHLFIIEFDLYGNVKLENDDHYRLHVVDIFPRLFCLDGLLVTASERQKTANFFDNSSLQRFPVRRHLQSTLFRPTSCKNLRYSGIIGSETYVFLKNFPDHIPLTDEFDKKKIMCLVEENMKLLKTENVDTEWIINFTENFLVKIDDVFNLMQLNVILTLIFTNVMFNLEKDVLFKALKANKVNIVDPSACSTICTLELDRKLLFLKVFLSLFTLSATKSRIKEECALELYHAMSNIYWALYRISDGCDLNKVFFKYQSRNVQTIYNFSKCLIATEAFITLSVVDDFFCNINDDPVINEIIDNACGRRHVAAQFPKTVDSMTMFNVLVAEMKSNVENILSVIRIPSLHYGLLLQGRSKISTDFAKKLSAINEHLHRGLHNPTNFIQEIDEQDIVMDIGDKVILSSQVMAIVLAVPERFSATVQIIKSPVMTGKSRIFKPETIRKIDVEQYCWNHEHCCWIPKDCSGDGVFLAEVSYCKPNENSTMKPTISTVTICDEKISKQQPNEDHDNVEIIFPLDYEGSLNQSFPSARSPTTTERIAPFEKKCIIPNTAEIIFSDLENCLRVGSLTESVQTNRSRSNSLISPISQKLAKVQNASAWLQNGNFVYPSIWWHSKNPFNIRKRYHIPGWQKRTV